MVGNHRVNQIKTKLDKLEREEKERNKMIINFDRSKIEEQQFLIKKSESVKNNLEQKINNFYQNEFINENKYLRRPEINNL